MKISKGDDDRKTSEHSSRVAVEVLHGVALLVHGIHQLRTDHADLIDDQHVLVRPQ